MEVASSSGERPSQQQRQRQPQDYVLTENLRQMLYGLADFPSPGLETLQLLEDYLRLRLGRWAQAAVVAAANGQREATPEALVAALGADRRALAHCVRFHGLLADTRRLARDGARAASGDADDAEDDGGEGGEDAESDVECESEDGGGRGDGGQQLPPYLEAAAAAAAEALPLLQAERQQRQQRLSRCSEALSPADYARFARSRRCGLLSRVNRSNGGQDLASFRRWLGPAGLRLSPSACRLLGYLGGQAVAELMDAVKLRRAETWPAEAMEQLDAEVSASAAEMREAMQLRRARLL